VACCFHRLVLGLFFGGRSTLDLGGAKYPELCFLGLEKVRRFKLRVIFHEPIYSKVRSRLSTEHATQVGFDGVHTVSEGLVTEIPVLTACSTPHVPAALPASSRLRLGDGYTLTATHGLETPRAITGLENLGAITQNSRAERDISR